MESWFVQPARRRIPLSDGQWIEVKQRLTAGEYRAHLRRSEGVGPDGKSRVDPYNHALSMIVAYLLDWSGSAVSDIRGASVTDLSSAVDALSVERFEEIRIAIEKHEEQMKKEREQEKNAMAGEKTSAAISPSLSAADGALTGSAV